MSYSQYGGLGYRNGELVEAASDAVITTEMDNLGRAGVWPGFTDAASRMGMEVFHDLRSRSVSGHVVMGDGPVLVSLHKQTAMEIHVLADGKFDEIDLVAIAVDLPDGLISDWGDGTLHLDSDALIRHGEPVRFEIDGHVVEYAVRQDPQLVQHVRLTQSDGTVWTGFSGSEIGAGHDDEDTAPVIVKHRAVFAD